MASHSASSSSSAGATPVSACDSLGWRVLDKNGDPISSGETWTEFRLDGEPIGVKLARLEIVRIVKAAAGVVDNMSLFAAAVAWYNAAADLAEAEESLEKAKADESLHPTALEKAKLEHEKAKLESAGKDTDDVSKQLTAVALQLLEVEKQVTQVREAAAAASAASLKGLPASEGVARLKLLAAVGSSAKSPSDMAKTEPWFPGACVLGYVPVHPGAAVEALRSLHVDENDIRFDERTRALMTLSAANPLAQSGESSDVQPQYNLVAATIGMRAQEGRIAWVLDQSTASAPGGTRTSLLDGSYSSTASIARNGKKLALAVLELKGNESSVLCAARQAYLYATGVVGSLLQMGIDPDEIIVPVIASNGEYLQCGGVFVLWPSCPVYAPVSRPFHLRNQEDAALAAAHIEKAVARAEETDKRLNDPERVPPFHRSPDDRDTLFLDLDRYFLKRLDDKRLQSGLGIHFGGDEMWAADRTAVTASMGLSHYFDVMNLLGASKEARLYVVFPLAFRHKDAQGAEGDPHNGDGCVDRIFDDALVFEDLARSDYPGGPFRTGLPEDTSLWSDCVAELRTAFKEVHSAGVVHCDPYPSNVMTRVDRETGKVEVRIIDWDAAHIAGRPWAKLARERLCTIYSERQGWGELGPDATGSHDDRYLDVLERIPFSADVLGDTEVEAIMAGICSGDEDKINKSFRSAASAICLDYSRS